MSQQRIGADQIDSSVATFTDLGEITDMFDGMEVYVRDIDRMYTWDSPTSGWILPKVQASQIEGFVAGTRNIDGGRADSVYTPAQKIDGGVA